MTQRLALAVLMLLALAVPRLQAQENPARQLVDLARPHEREVQALRFMLAVSPFRDTPAGFDECVVRSASTGFRTLFERVFAERLSSDEMRAAIDFYRSADAQALVDARNAHEQRQFDVALSGGRATPDQPACSEASRAAMQRFAATPAGRHFGSTSLDKDPAVRREIDAQRGAALATCANALLPAR